MKLNEIFRQSQITVCPECGQPIKLNDELYLNECDHCLSKKAE